MLFGLDAQKLRLCVNCAMHDLHSYAMKTRHSLFRAAGHIIKALNNAANAAENGSSIEMRKAKFLLTLAAAAAVMSTAAMSFAQWDTMKATAIGTVTLTQPIVVSATQTADSPAIFTAGTPNAEGVSTYTGSVAIKAAGVPDGTNASLTLTPTVIDTTNGNVDVKDNFTITIKKDSTTLTGGKDNAPNLTGAENTYSVELVPNDDDAAKALAGRALKVEVLAELAKASA